MRGTAWTTVGLQRRLCSSTTRHSVIGLITPADVHFGRAETVHADRARVLNAAYAATPERFVRHPPRAPALPTAAWINKPADERAATH